MVGFDAREHLETLAPTNGPASMLRTSEVRGDGAEPRPSPSSVTSSRASAAALSRPATTDDRNARDLAAAPSLPSPAASRIDGPATAAPADAVRLSDHALSAAPAATGPETRWPNTTTRPGPEVRARNG